MSIFDSIKEMLGGHIEDATQQITDIQENLPDAGQITEDAQAKAEEAKQGVEDNLPKL